MPDASQLAAFIVVSVILGATPGPDIIYVITRGASQGARAGVAAAAGLATGVIGHTVLCVVGLSAVLAASAIAFTAIKIAGAIYLIYLGVRMWRDKNAINLSDGHDRAMLADIYRQSILMNLLNPKVAIFFLAFLPQFVSTDAGSVPAQFAILGTIFMIVSFMVMSLAGLAGGFLRQAVMRDERIGHWIKFTAGGVMMALGVRLALQEQH
jgi:threonine/homoserine/homoserine lactone efflux protein